MAETSGFQRVFVTLGNRGTSTPRKTDISTVAPENPPGFEIRTNHLNPNLHDFGFHVNFQGCVIRDEIFRDETFTEFLRMVLGSTYRLFSGRWLLILSISEDFSKLHPFW